LITDLLKELNELDEHPTLEAKACRGDSLGQSFFETVCAFSNEPGLGGGRIVLGVGKSDEDLFGGYEAHGVGDPDKLQQDIATGCSEMFNIHIRPRVIPETHEGETVLIVEVDERAQGDKPVYFRKHGLPKGAWRRIGSTDQSCTDDDMVVFYGNRQGESYDLSIMSHADLDDLDPDAIEHYRTLRRKVNPEAEELGYDDLELLRSLHAVRREQDVWKPTLTGLLVFGKRSAHRRELPMVRVDYIRVAGKEWISDATKRFETTVDMRGPLLGLVDRVLAAVMDDLPKGFELSEGQVQAETPTLPARVLREAIVNALMHRSYREHQPTQVIRYSNRIEIRNAGFSLKNEDSLGQPGSDLRNPNLAAIFHETNTAETKGSGIRTMRRLMEENGFSLPTFESNRAENFFVSRLLLHHFLSEQDLLWLKQTPQDLTDGQKIALIFVREQGAVDNQTLRQLTGGEVLAVSQELRRLRDIHLLESKGKGSATYYVPGAGFPAAKQADQPAGHGTLGASHGTLSAGHGTLGASHGTLADSLPDGLRSKLEALGKRPGEKIRPMILELCAWRALTAAELAELFGRSDSKALKRDHLGPMIVDRELEYTHPDMERHPKQAYRITNTKPAP
jgi:ATP-dependent DNA helicase RecG